MEADALPLVWVRCVGFWFRVLSGPLYEERILRVAAFKDL